MRELKGWPFDPIRGTIPCNGIGDGVGPGAPG